MRVTGVREVKRMRKNSKTGSLCLSTAGKMNAAWAERVRRARNQVEGKETGRRKGAERGGN